MSTGKDGEEIGTPRDYCMNINLAASLENIEQFLKQLNIVLLYNTAVLLYSKENKNTHPHKNMYKDYP